MVSFGELLRRLRGTRSQREAAAELGMPVTTLSSLENQESTPRGPVLRKLAGYYRVPLTYFYPALASAPRVSESAKEWLRHLRDISAVDKETVAAHAAPEIPDEVRKQVAEAIRKKKHAETSNRE